MPGPPIAQLGNNGAPPVNNNGGSSSSTRAPAATRTSTRVGASTPTKGAPTPAKPATGSCRLKKREPVDADTIAADEEIVVRRPRHIMRIMGRNALGASMH
jgi:hypothetical protein